MNWSRTRQMAILSSIACLTAACAGGTSTSSPPSPAPEFTLAAPTHSGEALPTLTSALASTQVKLPTRSPTPLRPRATATTAEGQLEITVGDYYFYPQKATVKVGTVVTWVPVGYVVHTIVSEDPPGLFRGETAGAGTRPFKHTFRVPGVYKYTCDFHPSAMDAWITVIESP